MSQKIDPREVLTYLNELGYTNISAQQLKEFIIDLKKLIKHEKRHKRDYIEKVTGYSTRSLRTQCYDELYCPNEKSNITEKLNENNIFSSLYTQPTVASKAKEVPKRERQISVHIVKPRTNTPKHDHCIHLINQVRDSEDQSQFIINDEVPANVPKLEVDTESTIENVRPASSKQTVMSQASSKSQRPRSAFIRTGSTKSINRCDPVALYHYYQNEWKKQKFPGQETHLDLRWAVREKMLSAPKIDVHSRPTSCRRSHQSWKG